MEDLKDYQEQPRDKKGRFSSMEKERKKVLGVLDSGSKTGRITSDTPSVEEITKDIQRQDFEREQYAICDKEDALEVDMNLDTMTFDKEITLATAVELQGIHLEGYGTVYAGPYLLKPAGMKGIKLAPEINKEADLVLGIKDFGVPTVDQMDTGMLHALKYFQKSGCFFVGCMMGRGRTGTYLACLLKVFGYKLPIASVRRMYNPSAVETKAQEDFVENYPVEKFEYLVRFLSNNQ